MIFWFNLIKFAESGDQESADTISLNSKGELIETRGPVKVKVFWN